MTLSTALDASAKGVAMPILLLVILMLVWVGAYVVGLIVRRPDRVGEEHLPLWAKLVMIATTLTLAGWWIARSFPFVIDAGIFIVLGLLLGAVGDLILARVFSRIRQVEIASMIVFGIGHVCYILAALGARRWHGLSNLSVWIVMAAAAGLAVIAWRFLVYNPAGPRSLNVGSLWYGMLLLAAAAAIIQLWLETAMHLTFAIGIVLFAISDMLLAQYLIRKRDWPFLRDGVWLVYSAGQMLIAYSLGAILDLVDLTPPFI